MSKTTTLPVVGVVLLVILTHLYWNPRVESNRSQLHEQIQPVPEAGSNEKEDAARVRSLTGESTVVHPSSNLELPLQTLQVGPPDPVDHPLAQSSNASEHIATREEQRGEKRDDEKLLELLLKQRRCTNLTRPAFSTERQKWLPVNDRPINVFSAYYDPRPLFHGRSLIRLIAHGLQAEYNPIDAFYCQLWYDAFSEAIVTGPAEWKRNYRSIAFHDEYTAHFVLCPLPEDVTDVPKYVSVVATACDEPSNTHLILNRLEECPPHGMGVCISPLHRYDDSLQVIELMELHRLMGVQRFTMYKHSISSLIEKILAMYIDEGFLELVEWSLNDIEDKNLYYFDQRSAINDCLYRNRMKVKYVSVTDLDEFIVPRRFATWPEMIDYLEVNSEESIGAFLFQHYYFEKSIHHQGVEPPLVTLTRLMRTSSVFPAGKIRSKGIHNVQRTIMIDIHFGLEYVDGWTEVIVDPEVAALNHYRPHPMAVIENQRDSFEFVEDRLVYRYSEALTQAYTNRTLKI